MLISSSSKVKFNSLHSGPQGYTLANQKASCFSEPSSPCKAIMKKPAMSPSSCAQELDFAL